MLILSIVIGLTAFLLIAYVFLFTHDIVQPISGELDVFLFLHLGLDFLLYFPSSFAEFFGFLHCSYIE